MPKCDIVIPVWNRLQSTSDCIESIGRNTLYPHRLLVIDNASAPKTKQYLENLSRKKGEKNFILLRNEENTGFIKAVNKGISLSSAGYVCVLNNDTIVTRGWLQEMINVLNEDPRIGIVNPSSNTLGQKLPKGVTPDEYRENIKDPKGLFVDVGSAFGFCMLARKKLFDEIGLFDEIYGMGNFEDTDFSLRAKEKGYRIVRAFASYVYHKGQASFRFLRSFRKEFKKNRRIFEAKWGKTKRVMFVSGDTGAKSMARLKHVLEKYAKEKSWVYVAAPFFDTKEFFEKYSNLTFYHYGVFLYIQAFFKAIFKKKRPEIVYCDNEVFAGLMNMFRFFHKADIRKV